MLVKRHVLEEIASGRVSSVFRRWKRPTVKAGGSLRTVIGVLAIESVDCIDEKEITRQDARQAGYASRDELVADLNARREGSLYRITVRFAGADPRLDLRQQDNLSADDFEQIRRKLEKMDSRSRSGPWVTATLKLIEKHPAKRAPDLAESLGMETRHFKNHVRKLKELGLTEGLKVGYRLSPRGEAVKARIFS